MHLAAKMYKKRGFLCIQGVRCKKTGDFCASSADNAQKMTPARVCKVYHANFARRKCPV